jgi:tellurite resistance protein
MLLREDLLAIGKRNVERGQELVYRQRAVVRARQQAGLETEVNEDVLRLFERLLDKFEDDLARLSSSLKTTPALTGRTGSEDKQSALEQPLA